MTQPFLALASCRKSYSMTVMISSSAGFCESFSSEDDLEADEGCLEEGVVSSSCDLAAARASDIEGALGGMGTLILVVSRCVVMR